MTAKYFKYDEDYNLRPIYNDDVVEVVRCKNCKHCEQSPITGNYICHNNRISIKGFLRAEIDFCSRGERKETNG